MVQNLYESLCNYQLLRSLLPLADTNLMTENLLDNVFYTVT